MRVYVCMGCVCVCVCVGGGGGGGRGGVTTTYFAIPYRSV